MLQEKLTAQEVAGKLKEAIRLFPTFNPAQHKKYLVGLFVLKRISDKFMEQLEVEGDDDPNLFEVYVPEEARWETIRRATQNLGEVLRKAIDSLENQNPHLKGLLSWIDYNNPQEMPENVLIALLQHFNTISLKDENLENGAKTVGEAFIEFIAYVAEEHERREASKRLTPPDLNKLLAKLAEPKAGQRIYDPAAGTASTLIAVAQEADGRVTLFGQEIDPENFRLSKINAFLHEVDASLEYGDTLRSPAFVEGSQVQQFDIVVSHPEFSRKDWGSDVASNDPFNRFEFGVPPNSNGDWAFIQHILASLKEDGKAVVLMPHGVLFRSTGNEAEIRRKVLERDWLEAVIGLPEKIFYGVGIPGVVLVFNKSKPEDRKGKVLFVNGGKDYEAGTKRNRLRDEDIDRIVETCCQFGEAEGYSKVVILDEIAQNSYNLNIARYLPIATNEDEIDWNEVQAMLEVIKDERKNLEEVLQLVWETLEG
ncbi:MAG: class I SAM-dependent DNA methyltransferase [candidate division WOR-3 bacterium]